MSVLCFWICVYPCAVSDSSWRSIYSSGNPEGWIHYWYAMEELEPKLNLAACGQKSMPAGNEHLLTVDSKANECEPSNGIGIRWLSEQKYGGDLERGVQGTGPGGISLPGSAEKMFEESGGSFMQGSFSHSINGALEECAEKIRQCGLPGKEGRLGFPWNQAMANESAFWVPQNQSEISALEEDRSMAEAVSAVSGCSEKTRNGNAPKPGWKKPPRPPRAGARPSGERLMKGISDIALLRRAKLERMRSMKKHKFAKSSSANTSLWALLVTLSFCIIIILQGMFSQSSVSRQYSSPASEQRTALPLQNLDNHGAIDEPNQAV